MILPVKIGRGRKWGWAWSERFENRNQRNAFLRFILKGTWLQSGRITPSMLKIRFSTFYLYKEILGQTIGVAGATVSRWSWAMIFFFIMIKSHEMQHVPGSWTVLNGIFLPKQGKTGQNRLQ